MKKILFILPSLTIGGLERVQVTLANTLSRRGHDVTVMIYEKGSTLSSELDEKVKLIIKPPKSHPIMSRIPYVRYKFYDDGMWEKRATAQKLHKYYIGDEEYDLEIGFFRGMSIKIVSGCVSSKKIAWVHSDFTKATGYMNQFKNMWEVFEAYSRFDNVVCVSKHALEGFMQTIGDTGNLVTIYNLLPIEQILTKSKEKPGIVIPHHNFNIVLVGRLLDSAKGQKRLIDAVTKLQVEGLDIGVALVGGGSDEEMLRTYIQEQNADGFVCMTGNQMNPYPYIAQSDLLVCASYFEGYNLTVAEALVLGIPVLSTRCTGPVEILDDGKYGMIVENSTESLIDGLREIITNKELYQHFKEMTAERRDFFDEERIIGQIEGLFYE